MTSSRSLSILQQTASVTEVRVQRRHPSVLIQDPACVSQTRALDSACGGHSGSECCFSHGL